MQRKGKTAGQRLFSDAVRRDVVHTEPYFLLANGAELYAALSGNQGGDSQFTRRKRFLL